MSAYATNHYVLIFQNNYTKQTFVHDVLNTSTDTLFYKFAGFKFDKKAPYGEYNDTVLKAAEASNHITIQWNIDSLDYKGLTAEQMWERIEPKLQKGSIILMHNGTENTALSLDTLIKNIKEKGYEIVTVSDLIYKDNYTIDNNGVQHKL